MCISRIQFDNIIKLVYVLYKSCSDNTWPSRSQHNKDNNIINLFMEVAALVTVNLVILLWYICHNGSHMKPLSLTYQKIVVASSGADREGLDSIPKQQRSIAELF